MDSVLIAIGSTWFSDSEYACFTLVSVDNSTHTVSRIYLTKQEPLKSSNYHTLSHSGPLPILLTLKFLPTLSQL